MSSWKINNKEYAKKGNKLMWTVSLLDLTYLGWFLLVLFNKLLLPVFQPKFYFIISIHGKFYRNDTPDITDFNSPFQSDLTIMKNMSGESYIIANKVLLECPSVSR